MQIKRKFLAIFGLFVSLFAFTVINSAMVYADATIEANIFTDDNDVRWEYQRVTDAENEAEPESVSIMFYDKPESMSVIVIPSLSEVLSKVPNASQDLNTYYVKNATGELYGETKRTSTTDVTKVDFTNASKVQIIGVAPMINPEIETEVVFGENIVIGDNKSDAKIYAHDTGNGQSADISELVAEKMGLYLPNMTDSDKDYFSDFMKRDEYPNKYTYCNEAFGSFSSCEIEVETANYEGKGFANYKLKVTGFENIKYFGWNAFRNTEFNAANLEITLNANQTFGDSVFRNTNITKVTIMGDNMGTSTFADAANLTEVVLSDNVTKVQPFVFLNSGLTSISGLNNIEEVGIRAFKDTNLGDISFSKVKTIGVEAFKQAHITSLNLGDKIEKIDSWAFESNDIEEIYLPKSLNDLNAFNVFDKNPLKKATVAYDTQVAGTKKTPFHSYIGGKQCWGTDSDTSKPSCSLKELVVISPYGEDEEADSSHLLYTDFNGNLEEGANYDLDSYTISYNQPYTHEGARQIEENEADKHKNVIAPGYFSYIRLEKLTVGEGIEFIGANSFFSTQLKDIKLPETLKGIGCNAFSNAGGNGSRDRFDINLPEGLEFIGSRAFSGVTMMQNSLNLPDLYYIGDQAFYNTGVYDVYLGKKLEYVGYLALCGCWNLHDITFDFDVFGESQLVPGAAKMQFTEVNVATGPTISKDSARKTWGSIGLVNNAFTGIPEIRTVPDHRCEERNKIGWGDVCEQKFGTVTFTEEVQTDGVLRFYDFNAEKLDLSKANFTIHDDAGFYGSYIGELLLPENLTYIGGMAFSATAIEKPLHIPDSVEVINHKAFMNDRALNAGYYSYLPTITIENLPKNLKKIGAYAFCHQTLGFDDVDLENIEEIYPHAFEGTSIKSVHLHDKMSALGLYSFVKTPELKDVILDFDITTISIMGDSEKYYDGGSSTYDYNHSQLTTYENSFSRTQLSGSNFVNFFGDIEPDPENPYSYVHKNTYDTIIMRGRGGTGMQSNRAFFYRLKAQKIDLSDLDWTNIAVSLLQESTLGEVLLPNNLTTIDGTAFLWSKVEKPIEIPSTVQRIGNAAFQWGQFTINGLPEGLQVLESAAFYGTDIGDELVIPSTVNSIGWSAFNAGDTDVHYDKIIVKPDYLDFAITTNQNVFQMFWNVDVDELLIESSTLPVVASDTYNQYNVEFFDMPMDKVTLTNLTEITHNAFESCDELTEVDLSANTNISDIDIAAFAGDSKLSKVSFSDNIKDNTINLGPLAFAGTALKDISDANSSFNITAAKFNAEEAVFSNIDTLVNVSIPNSFNGGVIPDLTFYNDPELRSADLDYRISSIGNKAFTDDDKLIRLIIWGKDTDVIDQADIDSVEGMEPEELAAITGPTIPETTDIYAYSISAAEDLYAEESSENIRAGNFYALDEVMQLSSNNAHPKLNEDKTDFDKTGVILYGLRRDGVILESSELYNYTTAYKRAPESNAGRGADGNDDAALRAAYAAMILDTPVPMEEVDLSNENFAEVSFDIVNDGELINVHYPDGYTGAIRDTDLIPYSGSIIDIIVPDTGAATVIKTTIRIALPVIPVVILGYFIYKKKLARK